MITTRIQRKIDLFYSHSDLTLPKVKLESVHIEPENCCTCNMLGVVFMCIISVCFSQRVRRRCSRDRDNYTYCEAFWFDENGTMPEEPHDLTRFGGFFDLDFYNGRGLFNATTVYIQLNSSYPYYYVEMGVYWTDFGLNFTVNETESYFKYRNVRNFNNNEWIYVNATLDYKEYNNSRQTGTGIVARYGMNMSSDTTNGVLTDEIRVKIKFEEQITAQCKPDCRLSEVLLYTHPIPTVAPSFMPSSMPSTIPSSEPTNNPSFLPTGIPSGFPTVFPPTTIPTIEPTSIPTRLPSINPSRQPTDTPNANNAQNTTIATTGHELTVNTTAATTTIATINLTTTTDSISDTIDIGDTDGALSNNDKNVASQLMFATVFVVLFSL